MKQINLSFYKKLILAISSNCFLPIAIFLTFCFSNCKKDEIVQSDTVSDASAIGSQSSDRDVPDNTILGVKKANPYAVETIRNAYNNLYEPDIASLLPNYVYIRFLPQSPNDVKALYDSGLEFWDFPLDYEVIEMGESYHDPSIPEGNITWQYTVIPVGAPIPNVQYEILEQLSLVPEDCPIAIEALQITNNEYEIPDEYEPNPVLVNGKFDFDPKNGNNGEPEDPGNPNYPADGCGCPLPNHIRKPSGCVSVYDNMLNNWQGAIKLEVQVSKNRPLGIIFHKSDWTDQSGCWEINKKYHGKIHVWVKFKNELCRIKKMKNDVDLWNYTFPRRAYIGRFSGPNFNNIEIPFNWTNQTGTWAFRNWVSATANNAVFEYNAFCGKNQINYTPGGIVILISTWGTQNSGATPMLDKISFWNFIFNYSPLAIGLGVFKIVGIIPPPVLGVIAAWLYVAAPDIVLNVNNGNEVNADDIRELVYHELSHASHYDKVGDSYWLDVIDYTLQNVGGPSSPYGDGTAPGAGRCAVVESWGYAVGTILVEQRYGLNHSNGFPNTQTRWIRGLERNEHVGIWPHIKAPWHFDLYDNNPLNPPFVPEAPGLDDKVSGYTLGNIFSTMTSNTTSLQHEKNILQTIIPPGVNQTQYQTLASFYGLQ